MSTATEPKKSKSMTSEERGWLQKLGAALNAPVKPAGDSEPGAGKGESNAPNKREGGATQTSSAPAADPDAAKHEKEVLKLGSKGPAVGHLQKKLNANGAKLEVDEKFGPATDKAVKAFQKSKGLSPDGIVGPKTWTALGAGKEEPPKPPDTKPRRAVFIVTSAADNNAVKGAVVKLGDLTEKTGDTGQATISIPPGNHSFGVTADGFEQAIGTFEVTAGEESQKRVELKAVETATKVLLTVSPSGKSNKDDKLELKATVTVAGGKTPPPGTIQFVVILNGNSRQPLTKPVQHKNGEMTHKENLLPKGNHELFAVYSPTPPTQSVVETKSNVVSHEIVQTEKAEDKDVAKRIMATMEETDNTEFEKEVDKLRFREMRRLLNVIHLIQKAGKNFFVFRTDKPGRERIIVAALTIQREFSRDWFKLFSQLKEQDRKAVLARTPQKAKEAFELEKEPVDPPDPDAEPEDPNAKIVIEPAISTKAKIEFHSKLHGGFGTTEFEVKIGPNGRMKSVDIDMAIVAAKLKKVSGLGPVFDLEGKLSLGAGAEFKEHEQVIIKEVQGAIKGEVQLRFPEINVIKNVKFVLGVKFATDGQFHFEGAIVIPIPEI